MTLLPNGPGASTLLVGRAAPLARLRQLLEQARLGNGGIALLAGEAGVGKTRLVEESLRDAGDMLVLRGAANENAAPYGPLVAALRAYLRQEPNGFAACGPLAGYLALVLPELGPAHEGSDPPTLFEALGCAFRTVAARSPTVVFLDDLH